MNERDIYEVANQLEGFVGPDTPEYLAKFLLREGEEASKLADEIVRLRALSTGAEPMSGQTLIGRLLSRAEECDPGIVRNDWNMKDFGTLLREAANEIAALKSRIEIPSRADAVTPEGWMLVPKEPTEAMLNAWSYKWGDPNALNSWRAMIAAALATAPEGRRGMSAIDDIAAERQRQIDAEGWTPEHDDEHDKGEMARAAGCYALHGFYTSANWLSPPYDIENYLWPWELSWWKPTNTRRNLVKAGALIVAEIERLDRKAAQSLPVPAPSPFHMMRQKP